MHRSPGRVSGRYHLNNGRYGFRKNTVQSGPAPSAEDFASSTRRLNARQQSAAQENSKQEIARLESALFFQNARQEIARWESARQEITQQESARQENARRGSARQERARQDSARQEMQTYCCRLRSFFIKSFDSAEKYAGNFKSLSKKQNMVLLEESPEAARRGAGGGGAGPRSTSLDHGESLARAARAEAERQRLEAERKEAEQQRIQEEQQRIQEEERRAKIAASSSRIAAAGWHWYSVLDVPQTASIDEVKQAFRNLALLHHPDKNIDGSGDTFKEIKSAYEQGMRVIGTRSPSPN